MLPHGIINDDDDMKMNSVVFCCYCATALQLSWWQCGTYDHGGCGEYHCVTLY